VPITVPAAVKGLLTVGDTVRLASLPSPPASARASPKLPMGFLQRVSDLHAKLDHFIDGERTAGKTVSEGLAFDELHDQKVHTVLVTDVVERANVWVRKA
jgi:hypothetical protein